MTTGILLHILLQIIIPADPSGSVPVSPAELIQGTWLVQDAHFSDSSINFIHVGNLCISDSSYDFHPFENVLISPEITERFSFIRNLQGTVKLLCREDVDITDPRGSYIILGEISFDGGEVFLFRMDLETSELRISSAVSEIELFQITRTPDLTVLPDQL